METQEETAHSRATAVASSVVSLVLGAVLGVAASKVVDQTASIFLVSVSAAVIVLVAVLAYVALALERHHSKRVTDLKDAVDRVHQQVGEPADLTFERFEKSTGEYFRRLRIAVERLKPGDQVYVMTHHMRSVNDDAERNAVHTNARKAYLDALLQKAREGVIYRRILCFEPANADGQFRNDFVRNHIREHCLGMLDVAHFRPGDVAVKKAPAILMADIFIINHELGAISMETYAGTSQLYTAGALIVHDPPNGRLIDQLRAWWDEAYAKSTVVKKDDFTTQEMPNLAAG